MSTAAKTKQRMVRETSATIEEMVNGKIATREIRVRYFSPTGGGGFRFLADNPPPVCDTGEFKHSGEKHDQSYRTTDGA